MCKSFFLYGLVLFSFFFKIEDIKAGGTPVEIMFEERRLIVKGSFTVENPGEDSFSVSLRSVRLEDIGTSVAPGPVSRLRANSEIMKYYRRGPRSFEQTYRDFTDYWDKKLEASDPTVLYVLTEDTTEENPKHFGFLGLVPISSDTWNLYAVLQPEYQRRHIMSFALDYLLKNLIPTFRTHFLTYQAASVYRFLVITTSVENPFASHACSKAEEFSAVYPEYKMQYKLEHQEDRIRGEVVERTVHKWVLDLEGLPSL